MRSANHLRFMALWFLVLATSHTDGGALAWIEYVLALVCCMGAVSRSDR